MDIVTSTVAWFLDPTNWSGRDAIPLRVLEHVQLSVAAIVVALAIALPVGLFIGHTGRGAFIAVSLANIGRAVPSYAILVILFPISITLVAGTPFDFTFLPTFLAMTLLAIPPVVTNTYAGMRGVDPELVEAANGMGMRGSQILRDVEVPLALPVILAGIRTASVQVVATAALGAVIGGGGLGRYIIQGIARSDEARLVAGAVMVALLAILAEAAFSWLQRRSVPGASAGTSTELSRANNVMGTP